MRRMARTVLAAVGVAWGAGAWGALVPRLLILEAGEVAAADGTSLRTPPAGTALKGTPYVVQGGTAVPKGTTAWSFDVYRWGETPARDVTVVFAGTGNAVSALGWRGSDGTFGADAGTRWALSETMGVYVVEDAYRPGAIAPGALAGKTIAWAFLIFWEFE